MNDKQKIVLLLIALVCNFTFLATAETKSAPGFDNEPMIKERPIITKIDSTALKLQHPAVN